MEAVEDLVNLGVPVTQATDALGVSRATFYRQRKASQHPPQQVKRPKPARSLSKKERNQVLEHLHSERFVDKSPRSVFAELLDEDGVYLCSVRTMYRLLEEEGEVKERRRIVQHPNYEAPSLVATDSNQVWSWDITKLLGPRAWTYYHLYVVLDVFSRYVVGWMVAARESSVLADKLIRTCCARQKIKADELTLHSDRGPSMTSKQVAHLLADLGVTKSHSRPHVSNDNAYSEAQFKTLKYRPTFPKRFESLLHAQAFLQEFFAWYNLEHRHSRLGLLTPAVVHQGKAALVLKERQRTMDAVYSKCPERFVNGAPVIQAPATQVHLGVLTGPSSNTKNEHHEVSATTTHRSSNTIRP